jgi:hypothetical protein
MNIRNSSLSIVNAVAIFFGWFVGLLVSAESETIDRPQSDGSDLFGEHNFRTGRADSGVDPYGWYEEDM